MSGSLSVLSQFHLTGDRSGTGLADIGQLGLRPALFGAYRDLSKLRHDFPLVLSNGVAGTFARSLTEVVNDALRKIAPRGIAGERIRKHVLALEEDIRVLMQEGVEGTLLQLWDIAETKRLAAADEAGRKSFGDTLSRARAALEIDGELVGCDGETPAKVLTHVWAAVRESKARPSAEEIRELGVKLSNILKADALRSEKAVGAQALKRSVGSIHEQAFDFETMSDMLASTFANGAMSTKRRRRIHAALSVLTSQRFFDADGWDAKKSHRASLHAFVFDRCTSAFGAFHARLPEMVELVKAMTIARLEIDGRYSEARHDPFFERFDERFLEPDDFARFPPYLVCLRDGSEAEAEQAALAEILSSGLPIKVLVQCDDILGDPLASTRRHSLGLRGSRLAAMAIGLANAYVLQATSSVLYRMQEAVLRGMASGGPALFSIFSGLAGAAPDSGRNAAEISPYLRAAAAVESRASPSLVFDPTSGEDWASRFSLAGNPEAETEWPVRRLFYEDEDHQKTCEEIAFTFIDLAAADARYADGFAAVRRSEWHDAMVPVDAFLKLDATTAKGRVPYILMVDDDNALHKVVVDIRLIEAVRRCRSMWRNFQELAGIDNSHARTAVAQARELWERETARALADLKARPAPAPEPAASDQPAPVSAQAGSVATETKDAAEPPADSSDEPYIETPRCTSCDECFQINNRMFAYDDNKQAFVANPDAGTFRELVEAAENCQVSVIHPGKPRNLDEPGLEELIARAATFT